MDDAPDLHAPRVARLDVGGRVFASDDPALPQAIAQAYRQQQRPRCLCRPRGVEMYLARVGERYLIKRLPASGARHASGCAAFASTAAFGGLEPLLGTAILTDPSCGATTRRLDYALSVRPGREAPAQSSSASPPGTLRDAGLRLSLRSTLHFLWDEADLTQWRPSFKGKRSWERVRERLMLAASQKLAAGTPLASRLFVPEPFTLAEKEAISERRRAAWASAARRPDRPDRPQELLLLIAEVKQISPGRHGYKAVIRHIPEVAFSLDTALYRRIEHRFARELALWNASEHVRLVAIGPFGLNELGLPVLSSIFLMTTTHQWLPVETAIEQELVETLVAQNRAFSKVLRYDLSPDTRLASVVLADAGEPATPLFASPHQTRP